MGCQAMKVCTPEQLEGYLKAYGWTFTRDGDALWHSGWQGEERSYPLEISMSETWIRFEVVPFLAADPRAKRLTEFMAWLLELNHELHIVKLSMLGDGAIVISAHVLASGFTYDDLNDILGILGYYADVLDEKIHEKMKQLGERRPTTVGRTFVTQ